MSLTNQNFQNQVSALRNKKIAVLGFAREGQALIEFFNKNQITNYEIFDENPKAKDLNQDVKILKFKEYDFTGFDLVFRSPGISPYTNNLQNCNLTSQTQLWFDLYPHLKTICITGTKGKSTTASLITHLLNKLGKKAIHIGNIGRPLLDLEDPEQYDYLVIELSSYQLYGLNINPTFAVFLNLYPEHLNWHISFENYQKDKLRILDSSKSDLIRVIHHDLAEIIPKTEQVTIKFPFQEGAISCPALLGKHNQLNIQAAFSCLKGLNFDYANLTQAVTDFNPLPHRLETVYVNQNNVKFICDALSTIPQACQAALESHEEENLQLIIGGLDRGHDWNNFANYLAKKKIKIICFAESGEKIYAIINKLADRNCEIELCDSLEGSINFAKAKASPNSVVLFSPGAPSNPPFANYEERARCFAEVARA